MNCYLCDTHGRDVPAVAICQNCGVGLCRDHLDQDLLAARTHGMSRQQCTHSPVHEAKQRLRSAAQRSAAATSL